MIQGLFNLLSTDTTWKKYWKRAQEKLQKVDHSVETTSQLLSRVEAMHADLGAQLDLIQRSVTSIYEHIDGKTKSELASILQEIRLGRIEQGKLQAVLDAVRRALKYQQIVSVKDEDLKKLLEKISRSIDSGLPFHQSLELAIPVIPLLLTYKVDVGADIDLGAMWNELIEKVESKGKAKQSDIEK